MDYTAHGLLQGRILQRVAFPFSRGSSQPRDRTQLSHIAGGFFTSWATGRHKNTGVGSRSLPMSEMKWDEKLLENLEQKIYSIKHFNKLSLAVPENRLGWGKKSRTRRNYYINELMAIIQAKYDDYLDQFGSSLREVGFRMHFESRVSKICWGLWSEI